MRNLLISTASLSTVLFVSATAGAATLTVGPSGTYPVPCDAIAAAGDNDVIEIDTTGTYESDACVISQNGLTLRGVGQGRAKIDAKSAKLPAGNAIWVVQGDNLTVEKVELTGAVDAMKLTGAAIHQTGKGLTVNDCSIHDNDSGILIDDAAGAEVTIDSSELFSNGINQGDDPGHITVGKIAKLTVSSSYLHHGIRVSMIKSSAAENHILYNRITSESDGISRNSLDFPLGGLTYVIGNVFHRSATDEDNRMILYRLGQGTFNASSELFIVNNTFLSDKGQIALDSSLDTAGGDPLPIIRNNIFALPVGGDVVKPAEALESSNFQGDAMFADQAMFDLHLKDGSPCIDAGKDPGMGAGADLAPKNEYVHTASTAPRPVDDPIDIGAYEVPSMGTGGGGGAGGGGAGVGGGGQGGDQGPSSSSSSGTGGSTPNPMEDTGCDCRASGGSAGSSTGAAFAALGLALLYGARRKRSR